jgi:hypothetical protein
MKMAPQRNAAVAPSGPSPIVETGSAAAIALLAHLCASFGLFALAPEWITPLLIGCVTGLASRTPWERASSGTAIGLAFGVLVARPWFLGQMSVPAQAVVFVALGSIAAGAMAYALSRAPARRRAEWTAALSLVGVIIIGMWATTATVDSGAFDPGAPSVNEWLSTRPELGKTPADRDYYLRVFYDMHDGLPYYDAYARVYQSDPVGGYKLPNGVPGYRLPTIFYLWLLLPAQGAALPWAFLVFATLAVASAFAIGAQLSRPGTAVLGALMVAVAYLLIATSTWVTFVDGWAMSVTLAGIALFVASVRRDSRRLLWAAVAVMLAAAALREILVYPMLLAAASALTLPRDRRWRDTWPWLAGLGAFAALYAAHAAAIAGRVDPEGGVGFWMRGGFEHLLATLGFLRLFFGGAPWLLPVLTAVGLAGAVIVMLRRQRLGVFLTAAIAVPLAAFLFFGSGGRELDTGGIAGYWGVLVVPIALSLVPVVIDSALNRVAPATAARQ